MDSDKKRMLVFGGLIVIAIVVSVVYFFWGAVINKGTLRIIGKAPFTVEVFGISTNECQTSPCEIKLKRGLKDLIIKKEGYKTLITDATVKMWSTVDLNVELEVIPQVANTQSVPEDQKTEQYKLVPDKKTKMQKLVNANDTREVAIVYFQKALGNTLIIGNKNSILIISKPGNDQGVYLVNVKAQTREKLTDENLSEIKDGKWSLDGSYLIYKRKNSEFLWLLDSASKTTKQLQLTIGLAQISWIYNNDLMFITDQSYRSQGETEVDLVEEKAITGFTVGAYHAPENIYERIETFAQIPSLPTQVIATNNGQTVYFTINNEKFKVNLK